MEIKEREKLTGDIDGILIVVHKANGDHELDDVRHEYQKNIATQVHSHLKNGKCLDVFFVSGKADSVKQMLAAFQKDESLEYI